TSGSPRIIRASGRRPISRSQAATYQELRRNMNPAPMTFAAMVAFAPRLEQASCLIYGQLPIFWTATKAFAIDRSGICPDAGALRRLACLVLNRGRHPAAWPAAIQSHTGGNHEESRSDHQTV